MGDDLKKEHLDRKHTEGFIENCILCDNLKNTNVNNKPADLAIDVSDEVGVQLVF